MREYTGVYADSDCINLLRSGLHPSQKTLDETASAEPTSETIGELLIVSRSTHWLEGFSDGLNGRSAGVRANDDDDTEYTDGFVAGVECKEKYTTPGYAKQPLIISE